MRSLPVITAALLLLWPVNGSIAEGMMENLYSLSATGIDGEAVPLSGFEGKVALVVNVASRCGFTGQYEGLEKLYDQYKDRGFVVLGFPSNDFLGQEPGSNEEIKQFCKLNYDVSFPLFAKAPVTGKEKQPVYKYLTEEGPEETRGGVLWNFEKFLIDKNGLPVARFRSVTGPENKKIVSMIEELLGGK